MTGLPPAGAPWFLVDRLHPGAVLVDGAEGRHAATVRRIRVGEQVVLTDGHGHWASGPVTAAGRHDLTVDCGPVQDEVTPALRVTVVQALPKGERSELAIDLATEAGADGFVPWSAQRCVARWSADKAVKGVARWQTVARETAKQARRATVPPVADLVDLEGLAVRVRSADAAWVLHESATGPLTAAPRPESGELLLIVGPEGGVSPAELDTLVAAGAVAVRLGPQVLRTSTAAAVALGALGALGRWEPTAAADSRTDEERDR